MSDFWVHGRDFSVPQAVVRATSAPSVEPITWAEMKEALRIDTDDDQAFGTRLIVAAREYVEQAGSLMMIERSVLQQQTRFPYGDRALLFRVGPIASVTQVEYLDSSGNYAVLDAATYTLDSISRPPRLNVDPGTAWPHAPWARSDSVKVQAVAGYGTDALAVPEVLKQAMYMLLAYWYEQRSAYALDGKTLPAVGTGLMALVLQRLNTAVL